MSKKPSVTPKAKTEKAGLHKEILLIEVSISEYKVERKAHWKMFKKKMNNEIATLKKTINELPETGNIKSKKS